MKRAVLIGCGGIGAAYDLNNRDKRTSDSSDHSLTHASALKKIKEIQLIACIDPDIEQAQRVAHAFEIQNIFQTTQAALNAQINADIVIVCSPTAVHTDGIDFAVRCGAETVVCEKPISNNVEMSKDIIKHCRHHNIQLVINYFRLWDIQLIQLSDRIRHGEFGQLQSAHGCFVKGILHNGPHLINLYRDLLGPLHFHTITSLSPYVSCTLSADNHPGSVLHIQELDANAYNLFETVLYFEKAILHLEDGARRIRLRLPCTHPIYNSFIYPENESALTSSQGKALDALYQEILNSKKTKTEFRRNAQWCLDGEILCNEIHLAHTKILKRS